jgi:hypothetical protein
MSENKTFVIYGVKIDKVPDSFNVDPANKASPLRQYADYLRTLRNRVSDGYSIHVGSNLISHKPYPGLDRDSQASNLSIYVGMDIEYTQVEKYPAAFARLQYADFFSTLTTERRIYSGISWYDVDRRS